MSLAERLAQLDSELDALTTDPTALEDVRARVLAGRSSDLATVDAELSALAADVAGLDAVLDAAKQQAASRAAEVASTANERIAQAAAARAEVEARVAALSAEQDAARAERAERAEREAQEREAAAAQRAQREAEAREAAAAQRAQREAEALEAAAQQARREESAQAEAARAQAAAATAATPSEGGSPLADLMDDLPTSGLGDPAPSDDTDIFGADLFGDLGTDAFDAPQEELSDVVTSEGPAMGGDAPSALADLATLLELEEGAVARTSAAGASASATAKPAPEPAPSRPKTVPPPLPSDSVRPPALPAAALDIGRESFEDLSDELDILEVDDDFEIVFDEGPSEGDGTGTELDGPGLSPEEMAQAMATAVDQPRPTDDSASEGEDGGEKKGFFKKLFG